VRLRRRYLPLAAVLGVAAAVLPAVAASETAPTISAYDEPGFYGGHSWMPATATVGLGGVVRFANPYSEVPHGLKFTGGPATPTCSGIPAAAGTETGETNWHGECTFSAAGTYAFICTVHPGEMKGTVTVNADGTTTTTSTSPTTRTSHMAGGPVASVGAHSRLAQGVSSDFSMEVGYDFRGHGVWLIPHFGVTLRF